MKPAILYQSAAILAALAFLSACVTDDSEVVLYKMDQMNQRLDRFQKSYAEASKKQNEELEKLTQELVQGTNELGNTAGGWKKEIGDIQGSLNWLDTRYGETGSATETLPIKTTDETEEEAAALEAIPVLKMPPTPTPGPEVYPGEIPDETSPAEAQPTVAPPLETLPTEAPTPEVVRAETPVAVSTIPSVRGKNTGGDERSAYQAARNLYEAGKDSQAITAFQEYLSSFPASAHAAEARLYIGRSLRKQKNYNEALPSLRDASESSGDITIGPPALLVRGECLEALGMGVAAKTVYKTLVERFPQASEAETAKKRIAAMP